MRSQVAATPRVTNAEIYQQMREMLAEVKDLPRVDPERLDARLGGIERHLATVNGTVRENRENIIRLQNTDATLTNCVDRLEQKQNQHEQKLHTLDITAARLTVLITGGAGAGGLLGVLLTQAVRTLTGQP